MSAHSYQARRLQEPTSPLAADTNASPPKDHADSRPATYDFYKSPSLWWRTRSAGAFDVRDAQRLRIFLRESSKADDLQWNNALHGDSAAAIGVAVRVAWRKEHIGISADAALSAVLACALERNAAATFLLSAALDRRAKTDPHCASLAGSWLLASVKSPPVAPSD
jgi:hypothetical protein